MNPVSYTHLKVAFFFRWYYNNAVEPIRKVSTILCRSYQKETIGGYTTVSYTHLDVYKRQEQAERRPPHLRLHRHPVLEPGTNCRDQGQSAASVIE